MLDAGVPDGAEPGGPRRAGRGMVAQEVESVREVEREQQEKEVVRIVELEAAEVADTGANSESESKHDADGDEDLGYADVLG